MENPDNHIGKRWLWLMAAYGFVSVVLLHARYTITGLPQYAGTWGFVLGSNVEGAPDCYRILEPAIVSGLLAPLLGPHGAAVFYQLASAWVFLCIFHWHLRNWLTPAGAFAGTMLMAAVWPVSMKVQTPYGGDFLEVTFFAVSLCLLARGRYPHLLWVVGLATLNREAIIFITPAVFAVIFHRHSLKRAMFYAGGIVAVWGTIYGGLRLVLGLQPYYCEVLRIGTNMRGILGWLLHPSPLTLQAHLFAVFGVFWIIGLLPVSRRPVVLVKSLWMLPFYLIGAFTIALIGEARIFLGLAPLLIPLGLWNLFPSLRSILHDTELEPHR